MFQCSISCRLPQYSSLAEFPHAWIPYCMQATNAARRPRNEADSRSVVHEQSVNHHIFLNKKRARCYARVPTHCAGASYSYKGRGCLQSQLITSTISSKTVTWIGNFCEYKFSRNRPKSGVMVNPVSPNYCIPELLYPHTRDRANNHTHMSS